MENLFTSIRTSFKNRVTSPLLGSFIIAWILWNRNIVYSALFLSQEIVMNKHGLLKNEYLIVLLYEHCRLLYSIGLPILSIFVIYYLIPYIDEIIYEKDIENKDKKRDIKLNKEKGRENKKKEILDQKEENIIKEEEILDQKEGKRNIEYKEFLSNKTFSDQMGILKNVIYQNGGQVYSSGLNDTEREEFLSFTDLNGLIENVESGVITLTEKGKYILKLHENNNQLPF